MSSIEKYRRYFTKDCLMGPNSFRLLDELIRRKPSDVRFHRTLDLGCGFACISALIFLDLAPGSADPFDGGLPARSR